jgi:hypothetical protein
MVLGIKTSGGTSTGFKHYGGGVKKRVGTERRSDLKQSEVAAKDTRE